MRLKAPKLGRAGKFDTDNQACVLWRRHMARLLSAYMERGWVLRH